MDSRNTANKERRRQVSGPGRPLESIVAWAIPRWENGLSLISLHDAPVRQLSPPSRPDSITTSPPTAATTERNARTQRTNAERRPVRRAQCAVPGERSWGGFWRCADVDRDAD